MHKDFYSAIYQNNSINERRTNRSKRCNYCLSMKQKYISIDESLFQNSDPEGIYCL